MTCDFPDLGSASDWLRQISHEARQSEALPRIVDLGSHTSSVWNFYTSFSGVTFYRETSGGVAKLLFSPANLFKDQLSWEEDDGKGQDRKRCSRFFPLIIVHHALTIFQLLLFLLKCPVGASAEEKVQERLTGTASETTPQAKPVVMRPAYSMA